MESLGTFCRFLRPAPMASVAGVLLLALAAACGPSSSEPRSSTGDASGAKVPAPAVAPRGFAFEDVTAASGVAFQHDNGAAGSHHYVETMGPGVALFDADGDGDLDLYVVNGGPLPGDPSRPRPSNRLFRNRGDGTFEDVTEASAAGDEGYGMGVTVGDADGDGDLDLYLLNYGPNVFLRNDGQGHFERVVVGAEDPSWSVSGAFLDYDQDGDLDLYVVNYLRYDTRKEGPCQAGNLQIYCSPEQFPPAADRLYRNDGGAFTDVSREAGVEIEGRGMGIGIADLDGNGSPDAYVTNDRSFNFLYLNAGGRFVETAAEAGVGYGPTGYTEGGMGVAAADFTGAGRPSIFLTNFQKEPNRLYVNAGGGFFDDLSLRSGLGFPSTDMVGWGIGVVDIEGDGDLDLAVANGHVFDNAEAFIPGSAFALADQLYVNDGGGTFAVEDFPGVPASSRGLAAGDLDGDGDQDLVISACGGPLRIWRNRAGNPQRFLVVTLRAASGDPFAYGARLEARVGQHTLHRQVAAGGSYASHSDSRITLGLGAATGVDGLEIFWPDGSQEKVGAVSGGQAVVLGQGQGIIDSKPLAGAAGPAGETP